MNQEALIDIFRDLHAHPELGMEEYRTTARILEVLRAHDICTLDTGLKTGVIAVIGGRSAPSGRVIGLRCDMDALPIQEESGLEYASRVPGVMHACGHDLHTAVMLGAALLLKEQESSLPGTVKIVFQPSEENDRGGRAMVGTGLLEDVEEFFAIHSYPAFESGTLGIREGPVMAAPDRFRIVIHGRGTHAAQPYKGIDPIPAAATLALACQNILTRSLDPFIPAVLSVTHVEAGNTWNVVPEEALLEGTVRTLHAEARELIRSSLARMAESTAQTYGCTSEFFWTEGSPAVINDVGLCAYARELALSMGFRVDRQENTMGGEDFSQYLRHAPGVFIRVGTGGSYPSHHPRFTVDPSAIFPAAQFFARLAALRLGV